MVALKFKRDIAFRDIAFAEWRRLGRSTESGELCQRGACALNGPGCDGMGLTGLPTGVVIEILYKIGRYT